MIIAMEGTVVVTTKSPRDKKKCESERLEWYIARIVHYKKEYTTTHTYLLTMVTRPPPLLKKCFLRVFTKIRRGLPYL